MPMGTQNYNNKRKDISIYSKYGFANPDAKVDPSRITTGFWRGYLKLTIQPKKGEQNGRAVWNEEEGISIYLTHFKADIFKRELIDFIQNPDAYNTRGVISGNKRIIISNGKNLSVDCPVIIIQELDEEGVHSEYAYQINQAEYYYAIRNIDQDDPKKFDKQDYKFLELEALITLLDEHSKAMTCAQAYSYMDCSNYSKTTLNSKIASICDKLGIRKSGSSYNNSQPRSFKYNKEGSNSGSNEVTNYNSMDEIEDAIEE